MALITWKDDMSVGVEQFDHQHQKLVGMLNGLHEDLGKGMAADHMGRLIGELANYTKTHFKSEEEYMAKHNYPELEDHKEEHRNLTRQVVDFYQQFKAGKATMSVQMMNFLRDWLVNHIQGTDMKYKEFYKKEGII